MWARKVSLASLAVRGPVNAKFTLIYRKDEKKRTKNGEIHVFFEKEAAVTSMGNGIAASNGPEKLELQKNGGILVS